MNLLQQTLLELWLGDRDDLCVVGDDYQSIYALHRREPRAPARGPERFPQALVVRLEENYRSTPQVLALANRLVPKLGGAEKVLRADAAGRRRAGRAPVRRRPRTEGAAIVAEIRSLGVPLEEVAILVPHERAADRLRGAAARGRASRSRARRCSSATRPAGSAAQARAIAGAGGGGRARGRASTQAGSSACPTSSASGSWSARRTSRGSSRSLPSFDGDAAAFVAELRRALRLGRRRRARRPPADAAPREGARVRRGVPAAAAGEGAAVEAGAHRRGARRGAAPALRRHDARRSGCSGSRGPASASRFLAELGVDRSAAPAPTKARVDRRRRSGLREWRLERAKADDVPPYVVFHDSGAARDRRRAAGVARRARADQRASGRRSSSATAPTCSR